MDQFFANLKPGDFSLTTVVIAVLLFLYFKAWPWFINDYVPAHREAEKRRMDLEERRDTRDASMMQDLTRAMVKIETLLEQNVPLNNLLFQALLERVAPMPIKRDRAPRKSQQRAA